MEEMIDQIKAIGSDSVGLTDHGVVAGHLEFGRKCMDAKIKPIFGIEAYQARTSRKDSHPTDPIEWDENGKITRRTSNDAFHIILLAKNDIGLRNIWALSSLGYTDGWGGGGKPRVDLELLKEYRKGIIATSACMGSKVSYGIQRDDYGPAEELAKIFGDDWYIELHTYLTEKQQDINLELVSLANQKGWPLVYATDAHFSCKDDFEYHDTFTNLQHTTYHHPPCLYIQNEEEIRDTFFYLPKSKVDEAITNSVLIADRCNVTLPEKKNRIPVFFPNEPKKFGAKFFVDLVLENFKKKFLHPPTGYEERLIKELNVILDANLVDFFLIEWDLMKWAREEGIIIGPGRGSVGGSLVSYILGITDIDPLRYNLIFERFYNVGREAGGMPDIDSDFPTEDRQKAKDYLGTRYGEENIANLGTSLKLGSKAALRRCGKFLDIPEIDISRINGIVETTVDAGLNASWEEVMTTPELQDWIAKYPRMFELAGKFQGRIFAYGTHASGFLISDDPMKEVCPLKIYKGEASTQFDMHDAADLGFMKIDLLGLRNLDILLETKRLIKERYKVNWQFNILHHWPDDVIAKADIWHLLDKGLTVGLFQVEDGDAAKSIAKDMKCRSIEDLGALVALNRPGPLRGGYVHKYLKRRKGEEYEDIHPILHDILGDTYGVFVYQEQIIQFMTAIGFTLEEADEVRSIMGKKKTEKMKEFYPRYIAHATQHMEKEDAETIWDGILDFSKYGFNKSHAIAYGIILLWTLWTKAKYPSEYLLACMKVDPDDMGRYVAEAIRMGIAVLPPDINKSELQCSLNKDGSIIMGLTNIKGVGNAKWIIENRPFKTYERMQQLIEAQNEEFLAAKKRGEITGSSPKQQFGAGKQKAAYEAGAFDNLEERDWLSAKQIRTLQKKYLGIILNNPGPDILKEHAQLIKDSCVSYSTLTEPGIYIIAGTVMNFESKKTRTGHDMAFLDLEFEGESIRLAAFNDVLKRHGSKLEECAAIICNVKKTERGTNLIEVTRLK